MSDVIPTFGGREERQRGSNQGVDLIKRARPCGAKKRFQFCEGLFDGIEIGAVGREESKLRASAFDGGADIRVSMDGEVIEHDHVPTAQRRHQDLVDIRAKAGVVDRSIEDRRRRDAVGPERGDHRVRLPMPARRVITESRATRTATVSAQQIGGHAAFIEEDVLPHIAQRQPISPAAALSDDVGSPLFVGVDGFF